MEWILPARPELVVVPVDERGRLASGVLEAQGVGLDRDLHLEAQAVEIAPSVRGEREAGYGVAPARGLERVLPVDLALLVSRSRLAQLGAVVAGDLAKVVVDDAAGDAAVERGGGARQCGTARLPPATR